MLAAVPIKPFGVAKARLSPVLDAVDRSRLGRAVAANTLAAIASAGVTAVVVTASPVVARWAQRQGVEVIRDPDDGLSAAAAAAVAAIDGPWAIFHADLPWIAVPDVIAVANAVAKGQAVLAPAADGGTNVIAGSGSFPFAYGPGSFGRHLAAARGRSPVVLTRPGLALDLDTPRDYAIATTGRRGTWLLG